MKIPVSVLVPIVATYLASLFIGTAVASDNKKPEETPEAVYLNIHAWNSMNTFFSAVRNMQTTALAPNLTLPPSSEEAEITSIVNFKKPEDRNKETFEQIQRRIFQNLLQSFQNLPQLFPRLPNEITMNVFSFLNRGDLAAVTRVNKASRGLVVHEYRPTTENTARIPRYIIRTGFELGKKADFEYLNPAEEKESLKKETQSRIIQLAKTFLIKNYLPKDGGPNYGLASLDLGGAPVSTEFLSFLVDKFPRLKILNITPTKLSVKHLQILAGLRHLTSLDLGGMPVSGEILRFIVEHFPNLEILNLASAEGLNDENIQILAGLPRLTNLVINRTSVTGSTIDKLGPRRLSTGGQVRGLTSLSARNCQFTDDTVPELAKLRLKSLDVSFNAGLSGAGFSMLSGELERLGMAGIGFGDNIPGTFDLSKHTHLVEVDAHDNIILVGDNVGIFLNSMPVSLTSLDLEAGDPVDNAPSMIDGDLNNISRFNSLSALRLNNHWNLRFEQELVSLFPDTIQVLDVTGTDLTDVASGRLAKKLRKLQTLIAEENEALTGENLDQFQNLERVYLTGSGVTDDTEEDLKAVFQKRGKRLKIIIDDSHPEPPFGHFVANSPDRGSPQPPALSDDDTPPRSTTPELKLSPVKMQGSLTSSSVSSSSSSLRSYTPSLDISTLNQFGAPNLFMSSNSPFWNFDQFPDSSQILVFSTEAPLSSSSVSSVESSRRRSPNPGQRKKQKLGSESASSSSSSEACDPYSSTYPFDEFKGPMSISSALPKQVSALTTLFREKAIFHLDADGFKTGEDMFDKAIDNGDCFYDAFRQGLARFGENLTIKELRSRLAAVISEQDNSDPHHRNKHLKLVREVAINSGETEDDIELYLKMLPFTFDEKNAQKGQKWGRPKVEGKILAEIYGVKIEIMEINAGNPDAARAKAQAIVQDRMEGRTASPFVQNEDYFYMPRQVEADFSNGQDRTIYIGGYDGHFFPVFPKQSLDLRGKEDVKIPSI